MSGVVRQALTWCSRLSATVAGSQGGSSLRAASSRCGSSFPPPFPFPVCRDRRCRLACCKCTTPSGCEEGTPGLCRQRYAAALNFGCSFPVVTGSRMRWACAVRYSVVCSESSLILWMAGERSRFPLVWVWLAQLGAFLRVPAVVLTTGVSSSS